MNLLCLDLATKTGWAHSCGQSGVQEFALRRGDSPGMRWIAFRAWLLRMFDLLPIDLIAYEQPGRFYSGAAEHVIHGFIAVVEEIATVKKVEITSRTPQAIKKHALGDVKMKKRNKARMLMAAENKWPDKNFQDDNEADACLLLDLLQKELRLGPYTDQNQEFPAA